MKGSDMAELAIEGGPPVREAPWPRRLVITEREIKAVNELLEKERTQGGGRCMLPWALYASTLPRRSSARRLQILGRWRQSSGTTVSPSLPTLIRLP